MEIIKGDFKRRWHSGAKYVDLKIRGERRISRWVDDTFHSLDGRFSIISRNEYVEYSMPYRLRVPGLSLDRIELWADGKLVARCESLNLALNWLLLKVGTLHAPAELVAV